MAASAAGSGAVKLCYSSLNSRRLAPAKKLNGTIKFLVDTRNCSSSSMVERSFPIHAIDSQREEENPSLEDSGGSFISQEDLKYLGKLGAGSVIGAAVIKYGSIIFPEITRPNILQGLIMVSTPVVIAVFLLISKSRTKQSD
ncbi:hypothetical protein SLA2020_467700 [Shorea laevis]